MRALVPLPLVLPLVAAALTLVAHGRLRVQRAISLVALTATTAIAVALLALVERDGPAVVTIGGWARGIGIAYVADLLSALFLTVAMATVLCVLAFAVGQLRAVQESRYFHPLYLVLTAGVAGSFLSGDIFHLFVTFEVMLLASYVLLTQSGDDGQVRPAMTYVVVNLLSSTLFLTAVALLYGATGTLDMAALGDRVADLPPAVREALRLLFFLVFGIKAALFPLFFWLPDSYPTAPTSVTAVFAGLLTKVGVYAILRTQTVVFGVGDGSPDGFILVVAGATMLVGVLGAIAQDDVKRILSFHIVSQVGYMVFGIGLGTRAGLAATILFVVHHIPVKTALFLVGGLVEETTGSGALRRVGGLGRRMPAVAALFAPGALSLAGIPPFSGFFPKLALVQAGLAGGQYAIVAVSIVVSLFTLFSMTKIWAGVFWGDPEEPPPLARAREDGPLRPPRLMTAATVGLVAVTLGIAVSAGPLFDLALRAADPLLQAGAGR